MGVGVGVGVGVGGRAAVTDGQAKKLFLLLDFNPFTASMTIPK